MLASKTLAEHLVRGAIGVAALLGAYQIGPSHPYLAWILAVLMLIVFRGWPVCWITGLIQTISDRYSKSHEHTAERRTTDID
ncbi:MAG TPA: hypothetical protein VHL14_12515 [Steroidobacteraceae bacterium]|nr:hypothetical protein [Steroidobacteraceae bacterium]